MSTVGPPVLRSGWLLAVGVPVGIGVGVCAGLLVALQQDIAAVALPAMLGSVSVVGGILLAVRRFELFVLAFLVVRPSLDTVPGPVDAGFVAGVLFTGLSLWWLLRAAAAGTLHPVTAASRAGVGLAAVGILSALASVDPLASGQAGIKLLGGVLMLPVIAQVLSTRPEWAPWAMRSVVLSAVVPIGVALTQLGQAPTYDASGSVSRVSGTFVHPNPFATYLVVVLVVVAACIGAARRWERLLLLGIGAAGAVVLINTGARAAWLAAVIGVAYVAVRRHPRIVAPVAAALVLVVFSTPMVSARFSDLNDAPPVHGAPANSLEWRWQYWQTLPALTADRPVTGLGLETVALVKPEGLQPHNAWLQAYVELGVLGLVALSTLVVVLGIELRRRRRQALDAAGRLPAEIGIAVALGLLLQSVSENLLTQPFAYWYFAAACAYGIQTALPAPPRGAEPAVAGGRR